MATLRHVLVVSLLALAGLARAGTVPVDDTAFLGDLQLQFVPYHARCPSEEGYLERSFDGVIEPMRLVSAPEVSAALLLLEEGRPHLHLDLATVSVRLAPLRDPETCLVELPQLRRRRLPAFLPDTGPLRFDREKSPPIVERVTTRRRLFRLQVEF